MRYLNYARVWRYLRLPLAIATVTLGIVAVAVPSSSAPPIESSNHLEFGNPGGACTLLDKRVFVVCYDEEQKIPMWVAYKLRPSDLTGAVDRTDDFRPDEGLDDEVRSELRDYAASGYDRGHMAPAEDFSRSARAMSATFLRSNMAPQRPKLNRGKWTALEGQIRKYAQEVGTIWVVTGGLFTDHPPAHHRQAIGHGHVAVPTDFFKVVLGRDSDGEFSMFAFIMPNSLNPLRDRPATFVERVNDVERLSGLNLFDALDDPVENSLESATPEWPF